MTTNEQMAAMERVVIRHSGPGGVYGESLQIEDVCWEAKEEIAGQLREGVIAGRVDVGGQTYRWRLAD